MKTLEELFPYEYQGGGYFRERGIAVGKSAKILHGQEAIKYLYEAIEKENNES